MIPSTRTALASAVSLLLAASPAFAQIPGAAPLTRIGAAAAVAGRVLATAPNANVGRVIGSGKPVFLNDHVTTDAAGHLQILLLDQTVFTLGPNSDMVLDEFVYDPDAQTGKLQASVLKGTFRFVSGHMKHDSGDNMKIRTPSGTMGIRGTMAGGQTDGQQTDFFLLGPGSGNNAGEAPGSITVTNGGVTVIINTPGFGTHLAGNQAPPPPTDMRPRIKIILKSVASSGKTSGGGSGSGTGAAGTDTASAGKAAGQETAEGGQNAVVIIEQEDTNSDLDSVSTFANQDSSNHNINDGASTWEQIADAILAGVLVGQDQYSLNGAYACTGGTCGSGVAGTATGSLVIDWGARTVGSFGSNINLASATNGSNSFGGDSAQIQSMNFPSTTGPASISIPGGNFFGASSGSFTSGTAVLENEAGVVAKHADVVFSYSGNSSESITGAVSGDRAPLPPQ